MNPLDVIWIHDDLIAPPGPKMVVCVEPFMPFYFRINSNDNWRPCVPITRDFDDYIIKQALRNGGVIGKVSGSLCQPLIDALGYATGSRRDLNAIRAVLEGIK